MTSIQIQNKRTLNTESISDELTKYRNELEKTKDKIEPLKHADNYYQFVGTLDPFKYLKYTISDRYNTPSVSLAWIKMIEIISTYNIIEYLLDKAASQHPNFEASSSDPYGKYRNIEYITILDNAVLPGSCLLAIIHYICSIFRDSEIESKFYWYANTQCEEDMVTSNNDNLGFYENYKGESRWVGNCNTSDILGVNKLISDLGEEDPLKINLFISDVNVDLNGQFNKQEELHANTYYGQVCCALGSLAQGGCAIFKQFTFTTIPVVHLMAKLSECFESVHVFKPDASSQYNSENYFVCMGFKSDIGASVYDDIMDELSEFRPDRYDESYLEDSSYLLSISEASKQLIDNQISAINNHIDLYNAYITNPTETKRKITEKNKIITSSWFSRMKLMPLDSRKWINVVNTTEFRVKINTLPPVPDTLKCYSDKTPTRSPNKSPICSPNYSPSGYNSNSSNGKSRPASRSTSSDDIKSNYTGPGRKNSKESWEVKTKTKRKK